MIEYLDAEDLERLAHYLLGEALIRDRGLIASAAERPQAVVFGEECYPTVWEKAAALMHSIIQNHPLVDGNKRLGTEAALTLLELNDEEDADDVDTKERIALSVADGRIDDVDTLAVELRKLCTR